MGNYNAVKVHRKGSVELQFTSGKKITLMNIFYVPEIMKNLVSVNLLCKRRLKIELESDKCIVTKSGAFVGKGYACDEMFKLSINKVNVSVYIADSFDIWHARLAL